MAVMSPGDGPVIRHFLTPGSVAIVGASADETKTSGRPLGLLRQHGFSGPVYPVNPQRSVIGGEPCYPSVSAIPAVVELALVCVPAAQVPAVIAECQTAGIPAAYVISSGFDEAASEDAGASASRDLRTVIASGSTRVSGPNAEGIYNIIDDIPLGFSPATDYNRGLRTRPRPGNVAIVAQSGGLGFGILNQGLARGIDFSYVVSTGNETDLGVLEYVEYLLEDQHTTVIGLFLEGIDRPLVLRDLGRRAAAAGKAIVAAKVGRSPEAQQAAVSHTGHITGPSHLWSALFRQAGIVEVTDVAEFLDVLAVVSRFPKSAGRRVGVVTVSGGAGAWMTDVLRTSGLALPPLDDDLRQDLAPLLPYYAGSRNPVDTTAGAGGVDVQAHILGQVGAAANIDVVVAITSLLGAERGFQSAPLFAEVAAKTGKPLITFSYSQPAEGVLDAFAAQGMPVLLSQSGMARAINALASLGERQLTAPDPLASTVPALPAASDGSGVLTEKQVKDWLAACGIPVLPARLITSAGGAVAAAEEIGYPVVLKAQAAGIPHKSSAGVLALRLASADEVRAAFDAIAQRAVAVTNGRGIDGVLVEQMAPAGLELLIGISRDPDLGPFLTIGAGGIQTEILNDVVTIPAPASPEDVAAAVARLRVSSVLDLSGGAGPDMAAFCLLAARISALAAAAPELAELDLNPVIVAGRGDGAALADALAVRAREAGRLWIPCRASSSATSSAGSPAGSRS